MTWPSRTCRTNQPPWLWLVTAVVMSWPSNQNRSAARRLISATCLSLAGRTVGAATGVAAFALSGHCSSRSMMSLAAFLLTCWLATCSASFVTSSGMMPSASLLVSLRSSSDLMNAVCFGLA
jgi:hypothetical protein